MDAVGLTDEKLGEKMGVSRTTVWRWRTEQWRLDPLKMDDLAVALKLDSTQDLFRRPERPSIDGILKDADQDDYEATLDLARSLARRKARPSA